MQRLLSEDKVHFMGVLAHVNSTILKLQLSNRFTVEPLSEKQAVPFFAILDNLPEREMFHRLFMYYHCLHPDEKNVYFIAGSYDLTSKTHQGFPQEDYQSLENLIQEYLIPVIGLLRLYKEGGIWMPLRYSFCVKDGTPKVFSRLMEGLKIVSQEDYSIEDSELPDLQDFIQHVKVPFDEGFLQLALENYELSYRIHNPSLSFLSLMMGLEALVNDAPSEIQYRTSRNVAVLLGKDKAEADLIFKEIKKMYRKRSVIVHTGSVGSVDKEDLLKLRAYVRMCIKVIAKLKMNKNDLLDTLNITGFGKFRAN